MGNFRELRVWQGGIELAVDIYEITRLKPFVRDFGLTDQIQRAAVSISSNIAEGEERGTNRQAVYFFNVAKASSAEVITQLNIAHRIGYIDKVKFKELEDHAEKVRASLKNLIKARGGHNPLKVIGWALMTLLLPL